MGHVKLFTYGESPVKTVRLPKDPFMAAGYVSGLPGVRAEVKARAVLGAMVAEAVLAVHHDGQQEHRSSHPRITVTKGDRTDYHILLEVDADDEDSAYAAAYSIENGRGSYIDSKGRHQPATRGAGALKAAMHAMGV